MIVAWRSDMPGLPSSEKKTHMRMSAQGESVPSTMITSMHNQPKGAPNGPFGAQGGPQWTLWLRGLPMGPLGKGAPSWALWRPRGPLMGPVAPKGALMGPVAPKGAQGGLWHRHPRGPLGLIMH